jgi:hypothetical protein
MPVANITVATSQISPMAIMEITHVATVLSDDFVMRDVTMETCDLHISVVSAVYFSHSDMWLENSVSHC